MRTLTVEQLETSLLIAYQEAIEEELKLGTLSVTARSWR